MSESPDDIRLELERKVLEVVERILGDGPVFLIDLVVKGAAGSQQINVYVDSEAGPDVEILARLNREIGFALETEEIVAERYRLDVSTPGAERPLKLQRQYPKNIGRTLQVVVKGEGENKRTVEGKLLAVHEDRIDLEVKKKEVLPIAFEEIDTARVKLPW